MPVELSRTSMSTPAIRNNASPDSDPGAPLGSPSDAAAAYTIIFLCFLMILYNLLRRGWHYLPITSLGRQKDVF